MFVITGVKSQETITKTETINCSSSVDYVPFPMYIKYAEFNKLLYLGRVDIYLIKCEDDFYIKAEYDSARFLANYAIDPKLTTAMNKYNSKEKIEDFVSAANKFSLSDGITEDQLKVLIKQAILAKNNFVSLKIIDELFSGKKSTVINPYELNIAVLNKYLEENKAKFVKPPKSKGNSGEGEGKDGDMKEAKLFANEFMNLVSKIKLSDVDVHPFQPSFINLAGYTDFFGYVKDNANGTSQLEFTGSFRLRKNYSNRNIWFYNFYPYFNTTLLDAKNRTLYVSGDSVENNGAKEAVKYVHVLDFIQHNVVFTGAKQNIYFFNNRESTAGFQFYVDAGFNLYITKLARVQDADTSKWNANAFNFYLSLKARATPQNLSRRLTASLTLDVMPYTFLFDNGYTLNYGTKFQDGSSEFVRNTTVTKKNFIFRGQFDLQYSPKKGPKYFFRSGIYTQDMSLRSGNSFVQVMLGISKNIDLSSFGGGK